MSKRIAPAAVLGWKSEKNSTGFHGAFWLMQGTGAKAGWHMALMRQLCHCSGTHVI